MRNFNYIFYELGNYKNYKIFLKNNCYFQLHREK